MTARSTQAGGCSRSGPRRCLPQGLEATRLVAPPPAEQARPADAQGQGRSEALAERGADAADAEAQAGQSRSRTRGPGGRPPRVARKRKPGPSWYV